MVKPSKEFVLLVSLALTYCCLIENAVSDLQLDTAAPKLSQRFNYSCFQKTAILPFFASPMVAVQSGLKLNSAGVRLCARYLGDALELIICRVD